jgi:hypothetical protein
MFLLTLCIPVAARARLRHRLAGARYRFDPEPDRSEEINDFL